MLLLSGSQMPITMQNRISLSGMATGIFFLLAFWNLGSVVAQSKEELEQAKSAASDSLYETSLRACQNPLESQKPETWLNRVRVLSSIMDDPNLSARHSQSDLPSETANALLMLTALDGKGSFRYFTEPGLAGICMDLGNSGIHSLENARLYDSEEDARKAAGLLEKTMECYRLTGEAKSVVDNEWAKHGLDLNWIRFYTGVALRKSGNKTRASQIYSGLLEQEWPQKNLYLEAASLSDSLGLIAESIQILKTGLSKLPGNIDIGCALAQQYLKAGEIPEAESWLRRVGANGQARFHPEYAWAQGACFEKKGEFKKADAFYQNCYLADSNEVSVIRRYAAFLIRIAGLPEAPQADVLAARALAMLRRANSLSPDNQAVIREIETIRSRFPATGRF